MDYDAEHLPLNPHGIPAAFIKHLLVLVSRLLAVYFGSAELETLVGLPDVEYFCPGTRIAGWRIEFWKLGKN